LNAKAVSYEENVERCRKLVEAHVPSDVGVAVISKGDDRLVDLEGRPAWHLPSMLDGSYAGHYPADGGEAIAHVESLRGRGAAFLLIPQTSLWWLDHYSELRDHLERRYPAVADDPDAGRLYQLGAPTPTGAGAERTRRPLASPDPGVGELINALLPAAAPVGVLGLPSDATLDIGARPLRHMNKANTAQALDELSEQGGFVVLPADFRDRLERASAQLLDDRCRTVTEQRYVCTILAPRHAEAANEASDAPDPEEVRREEREHNLRAVRAVVARFVPERATIAVISRGDGELVRFEGRSGWHFPRQEDGVWSGHYPSDGGQAVDWMRRTAAAGAGWLVVPPAAGWWLEYYGELRRHLAVDAERVTGDGDEAAVFRLRPPTAGSRYRRLLDRWRSR